MNTNATKLIVAGLLFLFTLLSGIWVSHSGKPINIVIFTIHKVIALATMTVLAISFYNLYKALELHTFIELAILVSTGLLFLAMIITGAVLSRNTSWPSAILKIHQLVPLLALVSSAISIFVLIGRKA